MRARKVAWYGREALLGRLDRGWCPVCERRTVFAREAEYLRNGYRCVRCRTKPRHRALWARVLAEFPDWRELDIFEPAGAGRSADKFLEAPGYIRSQYYEGVEPGTMRDGVRVEDLERLTFADASLDLVITQDVFEHILRPEVAFAEIARVLRPGGAHIFTVPLTGGGATVPRARPGPSGVERLLPDVFHGNPADPEGGSLVTTDWGDDLAEVVDRCGPTTTTRFADPDPRVGVIGTLIDVFVSRRT